MRNPDHIVWADKRLSAPACAPLEVHSFAASASTPSVHAGSIPMDHANAVRTDGVLHEARKDVANTLQAACGRGCPGRNAPPGLFLHPV
jgi:hypothetical protein